MSYDPCPYNPELVAAWEAEWERTHAGRWHTNGTTDAGWLLYFPNRPLPPVTVPPPSRAVLLELERELNEGRQLSAENAE